MSWIESIRWREIWRPGVWAASIASVLGLCALIYPIGETLRALSYDLPFRIRGSRTTPSLEDVVIVYMDDKSATRLGQTPGSPWNPQVHADLVAKLTKAKAKAIVFDVLFTEVNATNAHLYQALADEIKRSGNVVVAASYEAPANRGPLSSAGKPELPVPAIAAVAPWGVVEFPREGDGVPRRQRFFRVGKSAQARTADRDQATDPPTIWTNFAWTAAGFIGRAPPDPGKTRLLNYYGGRDTIPSVSYPDVVLETNALPADRFAGKIVFVGKKSMIGTEGRTKDELPTPFSRWSGPQTPGVEIQATAFLNLIDHDWLTELAPIWERSEERRVGKECRSRWSPYH